MESLILLVPLLLLLIVLLILRFLIVPLLRRRRRLVSLMCIDTGRRLLEAYDRWWRGTVVLLCSVIRQGKMPAQRYVRSGRGVGLLLCGASGGLIRLVVGLSRAVISGRARVAPCDVYCVRRVPRGGPRHWRVKLKRRSGVSNTDLFCGLVHTGALLFVPYTEFPAHRFVKESHKEGPVRRGDDGQGGTTGALRENL